MRDTATSPAEASRRRRAVYQSVQALLSEQEIAEAVALCEHEFRMAKVLTATSFVSRLTDLLLLGDKQHTIHSNLVRALLLPADQLPPDPLPDASSVAEGPSQAAGSPSQTSQPVSLPAEAIVFSTLVRHVCEQLRRQDAQRMETVASGILESLSVSKLSKRAQEQICDWSGQLTGNASEITMSQESLIGAVQMLYIWSCQAYGPTLTDRVFGQAVRAAEQLPEAADFPPRRFL